MGFTAIIAAAGIGLSAYGMSKQMDAAENAASAQKSAIAAQQKAENARQQQMNLDASRRRRESIRQSIQARAFALANATAQGAENSSGLEGGYGQIAGRLGTNVLGINQNQELGNAMFGYNQEASRAYMREADFKSDAAVGQGLTSLGGALLTNIRPLTAFGNYVTNNAFRNTGNYRYY